MWWAPNAAAVSNRSWRGRSDSARCRLPAGAKKSARNSTWRWARPASSKIGFISTSELRGLELMRDVGVPQAESAEADAGGVARSGRAKSNVLHSRPT